MSNGVLLRPGRISGARDRGGVNRVKPPNPTLAPRRLRVAGRFLTAEPASPPAADTRTPLAFHVIPWQQASAGAGRQVNHGLATSSQSCTQPRRAAQKLAPEPLTARSPTCSGSAVTGCVPAPMAGPSPWRSGSRTASPSRPNPHQKVTSGESSRCCHLARRQHRFRPAASATWRPHQSPDIRHRPASRRQTTHERARPSRPSPWTSFTPMRG